ncbi:hypothetical protein BDZ45DRAFT_366327 [Acephala macrosclerotiorum]|nr:hypothetical protein BDZ45DRAFT_366327 [Acephala macrosclerotiorum]
MSSSLNSSHLEDPKSSVSKSRNKRFIGEKILSFLFDGPSGTDSQKLDRQLRDKYDEDKRDDVNRTEKEERERQARIKKRAEIMGGGDGVRTNDMQKEGWGGAMLAQDHA